MSVTVQRMLAATMVLIVLRLVAAAALPLSADEAYYWLWSRHLAPGYYDHPPAIAFVIRAGTLIFGNTSLGVRFGGFVLSIVASVFVWLAAETMLESREQAARATLFFNLMLMIFVEMLAATPDTPSIATSAMFLWALAKVDRTEDGRWWLAVGVAAGLALLSKYTAFFLGAGALAWMLFSTRGRRWFVSPWPYVAGGLALLIFLPNVLWENVHHWATFAFQLSRVTHGGFTLRFLFEFLGVQILFASPFIFALAALSMAFSSRGRNSHVFLLAALVAPSAVYFLVHSLHDRIQGNWPSFLYPMVALAAAEAFCRMDWQGWTKPVWRVSRAAATPVAAVMLAVVYAQALFGVIPVGRSDPLARLLAVGFGDVAKTIGETQRGIQASSIVTTDYENTAWLNFYMPAGTRIMQVGEIYRYPDAPVPDPTILGRPMLYVAEVQRDRSRDLMAQFSQVQEISRFDRLRRGVPVAHMILYRLSGPKGTLAARLP